MIPYYLTARNIWMEGNSYRYNMSEVKGTCNKRLLNEEPRVREMASVEAIVVGVEEDNVIWEV